MIRGDHDNQVARGRHLRILVGASDTPTAALRFAYEEARRRKVPLTAVRAWRCPLRETADYPPVAGEPERLYEERAVKQLESTLVDAPSDVELSRRTAEGPAAHCSPPPTGRVCW